MWIHFTEIPIVREALLISNQKLFAILEVKIIVHRLRSKFLKENYVNNVIIDYKFVIIVFFLLYSIL